MVASTGYLAGPDADFIKVSGNWILTFSIEIRSFSLFLHIALVALTLV